MISRQVLEPELRAGNRSPLASSGNVIVVDLVTMPMPLVDFGRRDRDAIETRLDGHFCETRSIVPPRSEDFGWATARPLRSVQLGDQRDHRMPVSRSNSVMCLLQPATVRANSMVANCIPKQIPRYGTPRSRAWRIDFIFSFRAATAEPSRHQDRVISDSRAGRRSRSARNRSTRSSRACSVWDFPRESSASVRDCRSRQPNSTYLPTCRTRNRAQRGGGLQPLASGSRLKDSRLGDATQEEAHDLVQSCRCASSESCRSSRTIPHRDHRVQRHIRKQRNLGRAHPRENRTVGPAQQPSGEIPISSTSARCAGSALVFSSRPPE